MRVNIVVILFFLIISCGCEVQKKDVNTTYVKFMCYDEVEYIIIGEQRGYNTGYGYMSPHLQKDGTPYTCDNSEQVK